MNNTKNYVVGFMFNEDGGHVALIRKNKPDWQRGKLNGIGGKIEEGELPIDAMVREFTEETGVITLPEEWKFFHEMSGGNNDDGGEFYVAFFACIGDIKQLKSMTEEKVEIVWLENLNPLRGDMVENLVWLVALARDFLNDGRPAYTKSIYP